MTILDSVIIICLPLYKYLIKPKINYLKFIIFYNKFKKLFITYSEIKVKFLEKIHMKI